MSMPVFRLQPLDAGSDHPAWEVSWHRAACWVVAETPQRARRYANGAFILPMKPATSDEVAVELPWTSAGLVEVQIIADAVEFGLPGTVTITPLSLLLTARALQEAAAPAMPADMFNLASRPLSQDRPRHSSR
jgi:hypothetical protein